MPNNHQWLHGLIHKVHYVAPIQIWDASPRSRARGFGRDTFVAGSSSSFEYGVLDADACVIATLAKAPRAFDSVRKRGRTPTDQSPVWQGPSHFQWDACALSLTPQITSGDCDYASDVPLPCVEPLPWEFVYALLA